LTGNNPSPNPSSLQLDLPLTSEEIFSKKLLPHNPKLQLNLHSPAMRAKFNLIKSQGGTNLTKIEPVVNENLRPIKRMDYA
jgi:hypothetical protein